MALSPDAAPNWMGRSILSADHTQGLDRAAALHEFHKRLPRHEAEEAAHADYVKEQRERAAAHHLRGLKSAHAAGDMDNARKHHAMYDLHMKALGHEPNDRPPPGIAYMANNAREPLHRFKAHPADLFALPKDSEQVAQKSEIVQRLEVLAKAARLADLLHVSLDQYTA